MEVQYISLNMTPTGVNPCFHISQYDVGRMLGFIVHSGGATVDLDTYTCTIEATRSDGTAITSAVATTDNIGTFEVTPTMSNKADKYRCQLVIVDENSKRIASLPFDMEVTKAAMDENSESIEEDASLYQQYTEAVQGAIAEANADIQAEENARIAAVNAEATARTNADITLQNNINAEATARQTADNTLQGNINSEASARASADSNLQSQINQIVAPSGEAPSAAEVENARIGANNVTYPTLGEAIRTQVTDLKSDLNNFKDDFYPLNLFNPSGTVDGKLVSRSNGSISNYALTCYCKIPINGATSVKVKNFPYATCGSQLGAAYDVNDTFKQGLYFASDSGSLTFIVSDIDYILVNCSIADKGKMMVFLDEDIPSEDVYLPYNTRINRNFVDKTLSVENKAADAKETGLIKSATHPILNNNNILVDPKITSVKTAPNSYVPNDGWYYISGYESSVVQKDAFSNALHFTRESAGNNYVVQDIDPSKLSAGTYIVRFSAKAGASNNLSAGMTGYPNAVSSGGTSLGSTIIAIQKSSVYEDYEIKFTITNPTIYNHVRLMMQFYSQDDLYVSDIMLAKTDTLNHYSDVRNLMRANLYQKTVAFDGDSITYGEGAVGGFSALIADKFDMTFINNAVSGATIATGTYWSDGVTPRHWVCKAVESINKDNYEYIIVEGGINDMGNNVPLGTVTSEYIYQENQVDTTTFAGAMEYLCWKLVTQFANNKKGFILPHRINRADYYPNNISLVFAQYREIAKTVCKKYGVPILDLGEVSGLNTYYADNKTAYTKDGDGVHPNLVGYKRFYVPQIITWMNAM